MLFCLTELIYIAITLNACTPQCKMGCIRSTKSNISQYEKLHTFFHWSFSEIPCACLHLAIPPWFTCTHALTHAHSLGAQNDWGLQIGRVRILHKWLAGVLNAKSDDTSSGLRAMARTLQDKVKSGRIPLVQATLSLVQRWPNQVYYLTLCNRDESNGIYSKKHCPVRTEPTSTDMLHTEKSTWNSSIGASKLNCAFIFSMPPNKYYLGEWEVHERWVSHALKTEYS